MATDRKVDFLGALGAAVYPTALTLVYFVILRDADGALQRATYAIGKVIQFGFPLAWFWAQSRSVPWPVLTRTRGLAAGVAFGAAVFIATYAVFFLLLRGSGNGETLRNVAAGKVDGFGISGVGAFALVGFAYSVGHSFLEEFYWRWFVFHGLRTRMGLAGAVVLSSVGFMAHHLVLLVTLFGGFDVLPVLLALLVAVGGATWAILYERCGSLLSPWVSHALVDAGIFSCGYWLLFD